MFEQLALRKLSQTLAFDMYIGVLECAHLVVRMARFFDIYIYKWKNHFFKMKGGYRDGLKHQKGRNKGSSHSKVAQSHMTPSLYLCFIVYYMQVIRITRMFILPIN
jgi:hypothetical protein